MGKIDFKKLIIASISGSAAMAVVMFLAPMMKMPEMNIGELLGTQMGMSESVGWVMHFVNGIIITWVYAAFLIDRLPFDGWKRGMIYSLIPWALMNFIAMPMIGMEVFADGMMAFVGSIIPHLAYGGVIGAIYTGEVSTDSASEESTGAAAAAAPAAEPAAAPTSEPEPSPEPEPETPAEEASEPEVDEAEGGTSGEEESGEDDDSASKTDDGEKE